MEVGHYNQPRSRAAHGRRVLIAGRCSETVYRQRRTLGRALQHDGWTVHFCGDAGDPRYVEALRQEGFVFHSLALDQKAKSPLKALRLLLAYRAIVRMIRPDVVHVFNAKPTIMGLLGSALAARTARVATIAGLGHIFMAKSKATQRIGQGAFRVALRFADAVIFYNPDDRQVFIEKRLVSREKAHLIQGSGIDLERFAPKQLPDGERLEVLFIGRLLREKGIADVIIAARELRRRKSSVRITIVGDLDHHNPSSLSRHEIDAAVADGLVAWSGPLHDVVPAIEKSHVVLLPSYREGIPLALVEGGAMGRALVATDVPGCRDVVRHEEGGLLVPLADVAALADALDRLATDRALVASYGAHSATFVRERFEATAVSRHVAALYEKILRS